MRRVVTTLAAAAVFAAGGTIALVQANERPPVSAHDAALPPPALQRPPVFLTKGKAATFKAYAAGNPKQLRLIVEGARGTRSVPLTANGAAFAGVVDAADTQGDTMTLRVEATYATTTLSSPEYVVTTTSAPLVVNPVQQQLVRTDAVNWAWGTGATNFGRVAGDESATVVPSSIATKPDGTVAVLDTANSRVVEFDLTGHVVNSTPLPSQTVEYLVSDPVTGNLTAIDVVNFVAYTIQNNTFQTINQLNLASIVDSLRGFYVSGVGATKHTVYGLLGDGSTVPVIIDGVAATVAQQETYRQVGIPTNGGFLLFEKADDALRVGITATTGGAGTSPVAPNVSVPLAETVLDVTPIDVRKVHKLAFLVTTFANGAVKDNLVRVNLTTGEATVADVTVDVPGDMTLRAAPLDTSVGIVLFTGNSTGGQVAVFNGLGV
jgi:hypothetical protein